MGYYVVSDGSSAPWRVRVRTGSFAAMGIVEALAPGLMVADLVALIASVDVLAPEVDRRLLSRGFAPPSDAPIPGSDLAIGLLAQPGSTPAEQAATEPRRLARRLVEMARDLEGKVVLITGGTSGIGRAAATLLAYRGATLVLVGRDPDKGAHVVGELRSTTANGRVGFLRGDLSRVDEVRRIAGEFLATHRRLDVLVNNAGAIFREHRLSADGIEMTFALNHVAHFLLTKLLLDVLRSTPGARVVSTSGIVHWLGKLEPGTVVRRDGRAGFAAYCDAKLATILFTRELARREGAHLVATCLHPGWVRTEFGKDGGRLMGLARLLAPLLARTPEQGADTLVWLATSAEAANHTGAYFSDRGIARTSARARDPFLAKRLWQLTEELCAGSTSGPGVVLRPTSIPQPEREARDDAR